MSIFQMVLVFVGVPMALLLYLPLLIRLSADQWFAARLNYHKQVLRENFNTKEKV